MAIFFILRTRTATPCLEFFISAADIAARPVAIAFGPTTSTSSPSRIAGSASTTPGTSTSPSGKKSLIVTR